jgi:hypothetical protein
MSKSASVVAALVLSLIGASPFEPRGVFRAASAAAAAPMRLAAATKLWAPKKSKPKSDDDDDSDTSKKEDEVLKPRTSPPPPSRSATPASSRSSKPAAAPRARRPIKMDPDAAAEDADEDSGDDDDDEDQPKVVKRRKKAAEEEEEEDEEEDVPLPSLPVIRPRLVSFETGVAAIGRSFHYNTPLQRDHAFPRMGYALSLEAFPLLRAPPGFYRHLGLGVTFERQSGSIDLVQAGNGSTSSYGLTQSRWGIDLRYFFAIGPHVVLVPAVGYGQSDADDAIPTAMAPMPSGCLVTNALPCVADANPAYLTVDFHLRVAATPALSLSLVPGYMLGVGVGKGAGQISSAEATASVQGFHVDVGASFLLKDWLALQATIPIREYMYTLTPTMTAATYRSANDLYYGLLAGVAVLAP